MEALQRKLQRQKRFTQDILSGMKDLVRVIDMNCEIIFINEPMEQLMGDTIGNLCYTALGKTEKCSHCISEITINNGKTHEKEEIIGNKIFSVISSPIRDENGNIYASVEVFRDITKVKKMEETILKQNLDMKRDIDFAKYIQNKILPKDGLHNNIALITSKYIPWESLGGDAFDIINIDKDNIGIYMADVAGHGVPASMMTMFTKEALENLGLAALKPSQVLRHLNLRYRELQLDDYYYITIIYGVYNKKSRVLKLANGGHNCMPLVFKKDKIHELFIPGIPICSLFNNDPYVEKSIKLEKGDRVLFYTDGISEAKNEKKNMYEERILEIASQNKNKNSLEIINSIIEDVEKFSNGNINDDIAIMMVEPI